jgi:hypothetical protein
MHAAEDRIPQRLVRARLLLEPDELARERLELLRRLGEEERKVLVRPQARRRK